MLPIEIPMIAAAFGWVAIYSHLIEPGQPLAYYEAYAMQVTPWVAMIVGVPSFYVVCRWVGSRSPAKAWPTAMALFGFYLLLDVPIALMFPSEQLPVGILVANWVVKGIACHLGGTHAARKVVLVG